MLVTMRSIVLFSLLCVAVGCGGSTGVKEPQKFAPMPDPKSVMDKDGNLKSSGSQSGSKAGTQFKQ